MNSAMRRAIKLQLSLSGENLRRIASCLVAAQMVCLAPTATVSATDKPAKVSANDSLLQSMQTELARAKEALSKTDPAPYYLSYTVYDQDLTVIAGAYGGLLADSTSKWRSADVTMRVGTPEMDNTHGQSRQSGMVSGTLPLGDDPDATARLLWELTDRAYKRAAPAFLNVKTNTAVRAEEEDKSPDFSKDAPQVHVDAKLKEPPFDRAAWESEVRRLSAAFRDYADVYYSTVMLQVSSSNSRTVTSEGT